MCSRSSSAALRPASGLAPAPSPVLPRRSFLCATLAIQRLRIGVRRDELDAHHAFTNHVVNGVAAGATDTDHLDDRAPFAFLHLLSR